LEITGDNDIYLLYPLEFEVIDSLPSVVKWNSTIVKIPQNTSVQVYNLKGNLMSSPLQPGIYIAKIRGEKINLNKKIVVTE